MKTQRQALVEAVRGFWDSLDSHLDLSVERNPKGKDPRIFHVDTSIDYCKRMLAALEALR